MIQSMTTFIDYLLTYLLIGYALSIIVCYKQITESIKACWFNIFSEIFAVSVLSFIYPLAIISYLYFIIKYQNKS